MMSIQVLERISDIAPRTVTDAERWQRWIADYRAGWDAYNQCRTLLMCCNDAMRAGWDARRYAQPTVDDVRKALEAFAAHCVEVR